MPRHARRPAKDPNAILVKEEDFEADTVESVVEDWEAVAKELGVALEPPPTYTRKAKDSRPEAPDVLTVTGALGTQAVEAEWTVEEGQDRRAYEAALLAKLLDKLRQRLTSDSRLLRRLRHSQLEATKKKLRAAWQSKRLEDVAEELRRDPLWLGLLKPTTAKAHLADVVRLAKRLGLSLKVHADDAAKARLATLTTKLDGVVRQAAEVLAPLHARSVQGFGPGDEEAVEAMTALFRAALTAAGTLATMAHGPQPPSVDAAVAELRDAVAALKAVEEDGEQPETPTAPSRSPSPAQPATKQPRLLPPSILKPPRPTPTGQGLGYIGLVIDAGEALRFASVAGEALEALAQEGVKVLHLRPEESYKEHVGGKVCLVIGMGADEHGKMAKVEEIIDKALNCAVLPSEAPTEDAVLAVFAKLKACLTNGKTSEQRKAKGAELSVGYGEGNIQDHVASRVRFGPVSDSELVAGAAGVMLEARNLWASPAAFLSSKAFGSVRAPTPGHDLLAEWEFPVTAGRRGASVAVAFLGATNFNGVDLVLFDYVTTLYHRRSPTKPKETEIFGEQVRPGLWSDVLQRTDQSHFQEAVYTFSSARLTAEDMERFKGQLVEEHILIGAIDVALTPPGLDLYDSAELADYLKAKAADPDPEEAAKVELLWARASVAGVLKDSPTTERKPELADVQEIKWAWQVFLGDNASSATSAASAKATPSPTPSSPRPGAQRRSSASPNSTGPKGRLSLSPDTHSPEDSQPLTDPDKTL